MYKKTFITLLTLVALALPALAHARLNIGVTLHPYFSFVANIVQDRAEVTPLIEAGYNPHGYSPQAADMQRAIELDVVVLNGIGHDEWAFEILQAAGRDDDLPKIYANDSVALMPVSGKDQSVNAHTFISTTAAIAQIYEIARRLGDLDPDNAAFYRSNARQYATHLRRIKADYMSSVADLDSSNFRAATMHGAYGYLMQEFGLQISAVVEPRHGVEPTARQLAETIDEINSSGVNVLFAEQYFASKLADTIENETEVKIFSFSHISDGEYSADHFEEDMRKNIEELIRALEFSASFDQQQDI
ncbi:MAG: zinc ABC transporter solute-binding protein [Porticoccaceae bacterium]|nr:zinc ABC transporter solute-binding protein [Porticoccaceae bacterium]